MTIQSSQSWPNSCQQFSHSRDAQTSQISVSAFSYFHNSNRSATTTASTSALATMPPLTFIPSTLFPYSPSPRKLLLCKRPRCAKPTLNHMTLGPLKLLNGRGASTTPALPPTPPSPPPTSTDIAADLKRKIQMLYVSHVSAEGVDYKSMRASPTFAEYVAETRLLEQLDLTQILRSDADKMSFFVNLYNALTQHAVTVLGAPPATSLFRLLFAMGVGYNVGGYRLSLNDMENGVLRANRSVALVGSPFGRGDTRNELCLRRVDARVHFVLNCGAASCPPVLFLTADNLESSLDMATKSFLGDRDNLEVVGNRVLLSKIFSWYMEDFAEGKGKRGILEWIVRNGEAEQESIKEVGRILERFAGEVALGWKPYDWSLNSV